jgi:S-phase kinase-associated protein 1
LPDQDEKAIPLPNVKSAVLKKVIEYLRYHVDNPPKEIEKPLKSQNMAEVCWFLNHGNKTRSQVVSQWDADFVNVEQEVLFELILVP